MTVIYKRDADELVFDYEQNGRDYGHVITGNGVHSEVVLVDVILARGYWEQVDNPDIKKYSEDQPRDELGRFGSGGGESSSETGGKEYPTAATAAPHEVAAVENYAGSGFQTINESLRSGDNIDQSTANEIATLDAVIASAPPLEENTELYRIVSGDIAETIMTLNAGDTFTDKGFASTSTSARFAESRYRVTSNKEDKVATIRISAPAGTSALDVNRYMPNNEYKHEREMLLPRGTTFEVDRVEGTNIYVKVANG